MKTDVLDSKPQFPNIHQNLINLCREGDQKAQFQVYKLYYKAMYNTSLRIVNNPVEAEDIMQESFLSAFEKIDAYSGSVSFGSWLKRIVINRSLDSLRREKRGMFENIDSIKESLIKNSDDMTCSEETEFRVQKVKDSIRLLPDGYRIVISLYLFEGYDHEEIARILSISPVTSRSQLSRAKRRLMSTPA
jgi:RNA polymerase sigma-70 factor (ECF subfamily)